MVHIAIMKKSWGLTKKILSGEKTIETRWYKHKVKPWNCIKAGETIYFKDSGEPVTIKAIVDKVEQYENLNENDINLLINNFSEKDLGTSEITKDIQEYIHGKKYAIIIYLKDVKAIKPFEIDKSGFGLMSAWLCMESLKIKDKREKIMEMEARLS